MNERREMVIHDVGAANFIPDHLMHTNMRFFHFDPDERGLAKLKTFYRESGFQPKAASFYNYALGESECKRNINLGQKNTSTSFYNSNNPVSVAAVQVYNPDSLIRSGELAAPNIIKIDVEGAELEVLRGYDLSRQELVLIEVEVTLKYNLYPEILGLLRDNEFELLKLRVHGDQEPVPKNKFQKRLQRKLRRLGISVETSGKGSQSFSEISTPLTQIEFVAIRRGESLYEFKQQIDEMYGIASRDSNHQLYTGSKPVNGIRNWLFQR